MLAVNYEYFLWFVKIGRWYFRRGDIVLNETSPIDGRLERGVRMDTSTLFLPVRVSEISPQNWIEAVDSKFYIYNLEACTQSPVVFFNFFLNSFQYTH